MKIAIYSRKSKFTGKGDSIENQIIKCKQFIQFKFDIDPENVEIFIDEGFSGKNENRPRYQDMIKKVKNKEIDSIIIYRLNRLGRNARDIHNTMQMCTDLDCIIYSATEGFDSSTSFGRAIIGILASLAQLEREDIASNVKENMYNLAKAGRWLGGQSPLGFDGTRELYIDENGKERSITKLKPNVEELKLVKLIYDKYIELKSLSQVSKWALTNNFRGKNGGNLGKSAINAILQNPVYVKSNEDVLKYLSDNGYEVCGNAYGNGILRYAKESECIAATGKHKGIIDATTWLEIQDIIKKNTEKAPRMGKTNTALLTGILKCECGSGMRVTYGHKNKEGVRPFYYTCSMKNNSGGTRCNSKNINGALLEEKLILFLKKYNANSLENELRKMFEETNRIESRININALDDSIDKCNKSIKKLLNKLKLTDDDELSNIILLEIKNEKDAIKKYQREKEELMNDQSTIAITQSEILEFINTLDDFNLNFNKLTIEQKQRKLKNLIERVTYKNDGFHIKFNIKKN